MAYSECGLTFVVNIFKRVFIMYSGLKCTMDVYAFAYNLDVHTVYASSSKIDQINAFLNDRAFVAILVI